MTRFMDILLLFFGFIFICLGIIGAFLPILPGPLTGWVGTKKEKMNCLNVSMQQFIAKNFDFSLTKKLDLPAGKYKFLIMLVVKPSGYSEAVKVQAPHPDIVKEIKRVVSIFPRMKPANQRGKNVGARFALPLTVVVE